jgi:MscS family membrane protein
MHWRGWSLVSACVVAVSVTSAAAQPPAAPAQSPAATPPKSAPATDPLARDTPRGTVLGFLGAARKAEIAVARQYLDTRADDAAGQALARQLFVVLDAKLPARLTQISDDPLGSRANPLSPHLEVVGAIEAASGEVEVILERVERRGHDPVWLFSKATLGAVSAL